MRINIIRYGMIVLLIALVAPTAGRADADHKQEKEVVIEGYPFGISSGQAARVSMAGTNVVFADGSVRFIKVSVSLLDMEGRVIAQSGEISVAPGQIRFWDVPREQLPLGEPSGRIQVRARMLITTHSFDVNRPRLQLVPTVEVIDASTGRTALISTEWVFVG